LVMSLGPILSALSGLPAGRIVDRIRAPAVIRLALLVMATGAVGLAVLPRLAGLLGYLGSVALLTPGYQMFLAANTMQTMDRAAPTSRGAVSGLLGLSRNLGLITGAALMGSVFAWASDGAATDGGSVGLEVTFGLATALLILARLLAEVRVSGHGTYPA
jgi:MFS family permease